MYPIFFRLPSWLPFMGGEPITSFGVFMFLSFLTGGMLLRSEMERTGHDPDRAWDLVFMAVLGGVIGAKAYYVLLNYEALLANPLSAIFSRGGMVWYGGFAGALLLIVIEIKRRSLPLGQIADLCSPTLAIGYAVGRMGCFLVGDDYGRPTGSWVGIKFPNGTPPTRVDDIERYFGVQVDPALVERFGQVVPVHPTQLYEIAMASLIFLVLWKLRVHEHGAGWLFWICSDPAQRRTLPGRVRSGEGRPIFRAPHPCSGYRHYPRARGSLGTAPNLVRGSGVRRRKSLTNRAG